MTGMDTAMMKIYYTKDKQLTRADDMTEGSWVCLTAPTENEVRQVAATLDIEPSDLFAATDPEESARITRSSSWTFPIRSPVPARGSTPPSPWASC